MEEIISRRLRLFYFFYCRVGVQQQHTCVVYVGICHFRQKFLDFIVKGLSSGRAFQLRVVRVISHQDQGFKFLISTKYILHTSKY